MIITVLARSELRRQYAQSSIHTAFHRRCHHHGPTNKLFALQFLSLHTISIYQQSSRMAPHPWKVRPAVPTSSLARLAEFTDSSWRGITNPVLRDQARDRYLVARFGDVKKIEPQGEGSKTKVVLKFTRTKGGPPKVGQVISQAGPHPTQKIITTWGSYVITKIGGAADLRHFPSTLDRLSRADLVHAYREVLFDVKSEPRSLWKSVKELSPEVFVALPDVLVEAMVGRPPRAVFQAAASRPSRRTEPRSDQEYHEALRNLQTWHQFPAHRALDYKEDARRRKRRERGRRPRGEPLPGAKLSPLRQVTNA